MGTTNKALTYKGMTDISHTRKAPQKIPFLNGVKGLACIIVFLCHFRMFGFYSLCNNILLRFFFYGDFAVCIFLIVSAFLMCHSFHTNNIEAVLMKRYFRIAIPIAIVCLVLILITLLPFDIHYNVMASNLNGNIPLMTMMDYSYKDEIKGMFLIPLGLSLGGLPQTWMIKYVFYGTFMCAGLELMSKQMPKDVTIFVFCLFCSTLFFFVDVYYVNIIFGFLLYKYYRFYLADSYSRFTSFYSTAIFTISIIALVSLYIILDNIKGFKSTILAVLFVIAVFHSKHLQRFFSNRMMQWLGRLSFSLYLWHVLLLCTFTSFMYLKTYELEGALQSMILLLSSLTLLLLISQISKIVIEDRLSTQLTTIIMGLLQHK